MTYKYILLILLSLSSFAKENSYSLFIEACKHAGEMKDSWEKGLYNELRDAIKNNTPPSQQLLNELTKSQSFLNLLHKSRNLDTWKSPDPRKADFNSSYLELSQWRFLSQLSSLIIREKSVNDKPDEALRSISDFKYIGHKYCKNNTTIAHLINIASQKIIILNNDMSILDKCSLSYFDTLYQLTNINPNINQFFSGEKHQCMNTIKNTIFLTLKDIQPTLIKILKEQDYDSKLLEKIKNGDALSIKQWEDIVIKNYIRKFDHRLSLYQKTPPKDLYLLSQQFHKEDEGKEIKKTDALIKIWKDKISKISDKSDLSSLEGLHQNIGEEISLILNSMFIVDFCSAILRLKEYQSYERLILIRMAKRIYFKKTQTKIGTLQDLVDFKILEPEVIIDPLSQKEFLINDQNQVYGVGLDFDDDLGAPYNRRDKNGDIILPIKVSRQQL